MAFYKCDKKQNGGTGFKVDDVSNFTVSSKKTVRQVTLTWTDPDDFKIEGTVQAKWAGTIIVRKAFSEPTSSCDGTIIVNNTVKDQYSVNGFEDTNVAFGIEYFYRAFPYTTDGVITSGSSSSVELSESIICGVEWDGTSSSKWTRTDDAADFVDPVPSMSDGNGGFTSGSSPFDEISPWSEMTRAIGYTWGTGVSIHEYYYKWSRNGRKIKLQISNKPLEGFHIAPIFDTNTHADTAYVGAYPCVRNTYKSESGEKPASGYTIGDFRTNIHNLDSKTWLWDYRMYWTIAMLYLVEYADWNVQKTIGVGQATTLENCGATDAMTYHTGTTATSRSKKGHVRYRYIEDLWASRYAWCDGVYFEGANIYCVNDPASNGNYANGTLVGTRQLNEGKNYTALITDWTNPENIEGFEYALYPSDGIESDIDYSTYVCDRVTNYADETTNVLYVGGTLNSFDVGESGNENGLFYMVSTHRTDEQNSYVGARLMSFIV